MRKSTRAAAAASRKQSTLSFNHRITKNTPKSAKDSSLSAAFAPRNSPKKEREQCPEPSDHRLEQDEEPRLPQTAKVAHRLSGPEARAKIISDKAIEEYWSQIESQRQTARIHNEPLTTGEKVLRYFDVSSQYGPCIGITRQKRWHRAERLGLTPPIEVLAVLLKEEAEGNSSVQKAHLDDLMSATAMGST